MNFKEAQKVLDRLYDPEANSTARQRLFGRHQALANEALAIMRKKNDGYAKADAPYRNFEMFGLLGVVVRMSDKVSRLRSFLESGIATVQEESIEDTILDLINYSVIFESMRQEGFK